MEDCVGLMGGLRGLPAMGTLYCLGTGWSQWRPLDIPGTHLPYGTMQLLISVKKVSLCYLLQLLFTTAGQLVSGFEDTYKEQITQSYNRVVDTGQYIAGIVSLPNPQ